jgi:uncharacterized protein (UPF0261 family)
VRDRLAALRVDAVVIDSGILGDPTIAADVTVVDILGLNGISRRKRYFHNPVATLVRLDHDEEARLGALIAERLNEAVGPVRVVAPTRGFSLADAEGGELWDPVADGAFLDVLSGALRSDIPFEAVDAQPFADVVPERCLSLVSETVDV